MSLAADGGWHSACAHREQYFPQLQLGSSLGLGRSELRSILSFRDEDRVDSDGDLVAHGSPAEYSVPDDLLQDGRPGQLWDSRERIHQQHHYGPGVQISESFPALEEVLQHEEALQGDERPVVG